MKRIALTFDDGPNTLTTPLVLDVLEKEGITASFFLISDSIMPESASVARRAFEMGCEINNHSKTHNAMNKMLPEQIRMKIDECTERIIEITGQKPRFFRPPYIAVNQVLFDTIREMTFICGNGCEDWVPTVTAQERIDRLLADPRDGDIILLHDMPGNVNTVEAIKEVIPELKQRGFRFVTCGQMFDECGIIPRHGWLYSNVYQTEPRNGL